MRFCLSFISRCFVLVLLTLLAGCRSERLAFGFQPILLQVSIDSTVSQSQLGSISVATLNTAKVKVRQSTTRKLPLSSATLWRFEKRAKPLLLLPRNPDGTGLEKLKRVRRQHPLSIQLKSHTPNSELDGLGAAFWGLLCVCAGLLMLLIGLFSSSLIIAVTGFGISALSLLYLLVKFGFV